MHSERDYGGIARKRLGLETRDSRLEIRSDSERKYLSEESPSLTLNGLRVQHHESRLASADSRLSNPESRFLSDQSPITNHQSLRMVARSAP
jgi:hypothetical protein